MGQTSKEERERWGSKENEFLAGKSLRRLVADADQLEKESEEVLRLKAGIKDVLGIGPGSFSKKVGVIRCQRSKNPSGTDTWVVGRPCDCEACMAFLALAKLIDPDMRF